MTNNTYTNDIVANIHHKPINTTYCQPANVLPHFWYYKIVDKDGSPDLPCIMILSELFGWFRGAPQTNHYHNSQKHLPELVEDQLIVSYDYLSEKLNFQKERIRRKLVRLEELGVLSRETRNVALEDGSRINQLYISIDQDFFTNCFRDPDLDIRVGDEEFSTNYFSVFETTPPYGGDHISKKNKNRSIESNFNFFENENIEQASNTEPKTFNESISKLKEAQKLEDFYPLTEQDGQELQSKSGRSFTLNAMNEILKDMSKKLTQPEFWSKKGFISYMTQAFRYEKRNPELISGENFKIRNAMNKEELEYREKEKYLEEIEYSLQTGAEWHFRKKLACVFSTNKAYEILRSYKKLRIEEGGICELEFRNYIQLSENDRNLILSQIQATHEGIEEYGTEGFAKITSLKIKTPEYQPKKQNMAVSEIDKQEQTKNQTRWDKIRSVFASYYKREEGSHLNKNWLSKLDAQIDEKQKIVRLKTSSEFYLEYIKNNLFAELNNAIAQEGLKLHLIEC